MSKKTILEITNLKKFFVNKGHVNKAVDDVTFDVKEGEIVGLIGESGSGKTTIGRSLLRLYDDFNGFVRLEGKLISGKRISKKTRKFMRKNIQMIFQDPMAALNGQNTIFSILKEPLIVNKIIKNKVKEINKNWESVQDHFHYTFLETVLKFKLQNLKIQNSLLKPFSDKWRKILSETSFDNDETSFDDKFNSYFSFLEEKNKNNSTIINDLYTNSDNLIKLYEEHKEKLEKGEIDFDEIAYDKAKENYLKALRLNKKTQKFYDLKESKKESFVQLKDSIINWFEDYRTSKNSIKNLISELKHESKLNKNESLVGRNLEVYYFKLKLYLLNKKVEKIFKSNKRKINYLSFEELQKLIKELETLSVPIFEKDLNINPYDFNSIKSYKNKLIEIVDQQYKFDFSEYTRISADRKKTYKNQIFLSLKNFISIFKQEIKEFFQKPIKNEEAVLQAKKELEEAKKINQDEVNKYVSLFTQRINLLNKEIEKETELLKKLRALSKSNNELFNLTHKKFNEFYKENHLNKLLTKNKELRKIKNINNKDKLQLQKNEQELKQAKVDLKVYNTNVKDKWNGIASFDIELKYLNKDLENTYILLGNSKFDLWSRKQHKLISYIANKLYKPIKLLRIKNLFIKTKIYKSLEDVGLLKQFAYRYPHEFSGGQRQRIVIARALITEPKVIVADEPIASLDISIQAQVVNLLKDLCIQKNIGMVFIAHDLSMIEYIADRVQIMHLGKIVESGDTTEIYKQPLHPYTINLFKAIPKISNANEKFKDVKFELAYMKEQEYPNIPFTQPVSAQNNHFIYGTKSQFNKWVKKEND
ncbi:peptide ABC transporter ATP-binding protein [Mycoplasmopsis canis]|uniref:ATP-binding cassette domain-containing protein n=1 Tax=Mycoplasmopsis canis TaxID=29555 RepID=UPI000624ACBD|nr:ATP-binding cassette domain-containing protein [Mycoplasmopsis canis]AKF41070.1 peptide ABC transporter ATP-binding protein [Mycoplasmopsis canis]